MNSTAPVRFGIMVALVSGGFIPSAFCEGQTSTTFRVVADVFSLANPGLAVGSARSQSSLSVGSLSMVGSQHGGGYAIAVGFQAATEGLDSDYDGITDDADPDDDNDGRPDGSDAFIFDTDDDGSNNLGVDEDDDNDLLTDADEWRYGTLLCRQDTDGDTFSDFIEVYVTETDPTDLVDHLRCTGIDKQSNTVTIVWSSVPGKSDYYLQAIDDLTQTGDWATVGGPYTATGHVSSTTHLDDSTGRFYRISVPYDLNP